MSNPTTGYPDIAIPTFSAVGGALVALDTVTVGVRGLWVGGAGNVNVTWADGSSVTISGVAAGTLLPISPAKVNTASTTATLLVFFF